MEKSLVEGVMQISGDGFRKQGLLILVESIDSGLFSEQLHILPWVGGRVHVKKIQACKRLDELLPSGTSHAKRTSLDGIFVLTHPGPPPPPPPPPSQKKLSVSLWFSLPKKQ